MYLAFFPEVLLAIYSRQDSYTQLQTQHLELLLRLAYHSEDKSEPVINWSRRIQIPL